MALAGAALVALQTGCATVGGAHKEYNVPAYRPKNPDAVEVKVSLRNRAVYVMEGERPLLVTATAVGRGDSPTPKGTFQVYLRDATRRNRTYGFWISGSSVIPGRSGARPGPGYKFVGYPMAYWTEFSPAYGFHEGSVWPVPRSKGCLRLHKNVAPKFFALTKIGTPVNIADSQPEDLTIGRDIPRPQDYNEPERPVAVLASPAAYTKPKGPLFAD
jgi:lipoprotein-anchoring transpeptidase ErfK/SrfK